MFICDICMISWNPKVFNLPFRNGHQDGPTSSSLSISSGTQHQTIKLHEMLSRFWFIKMIQDMFLYW